MKTLSRFTLITIALVVLCSLLSGCESKSLDDLFDDINERGLGQSQPAWQIIEHFQIEGRGVCYEEVTTWDTELKDYLGEKYLKSTESMIETDPPTVEKCTLYLVAGETNFLYIIKKDSEGRFSLWKYYEHYDYPDYIYKLYESAFPSADTSPITEEELESIIYGTENTK